MLEIDGLSKSFGNVAAVREVSFAAADGQITALLGPNGAGKSTTLRMLYTVLKPDSGSARIDGIDVVRDPLAARRAMGVLPHSAGLYPHLTARENIRYYGRLHGLDPATIETRIDALAGTLEMEPFIERRAKGFSHGQRTKVALARALIHEPRNVILDEPTSGLDVMATRSLRTMIRELKSRGNCVLFSSHVMQEVAALCDRIVIIAHGRVVANGTPDEIRGQMGVDDLEDAFVQAVMDSAEPAA